jgi:hypothetical protein
MLTIASAIGSPAIGGTFAAEHVAGYAGPFRPDVVLTGFAWGLIGGAIGGFLGGGSARRGRAVEDSATH